MQVILKYAAVFIMQRLFASFSVADFVVQEIGIEDIVKKSIWKQEKDNG